MKKGPGKNWLHESMHKARSLHHSAARPLHLLLVLLDLPGDDPTRMALAAAHVTSESLALDSKRSRCRSTNATPALIAVDAFAQGLAVARGEREPSAADELVALCWHPNTWLADQDPRRRILRKLQAAGYNVPDSPLPRRERIHFTQRVEIERQHLGTAIELLARSHPPRTQPTWGFNYLAKKRAVLLAEEGIDLSAIASEAARGEPRPYPRLG